jgi:hypothetical protein
MYESAAFLPQMIQIKLTEFLNPLTSTRHIINHIFPRRIHRFLSVWRLKLTIHRQQNANYGVRFEILPHFDPIQAVLLYGTMIASSYGSRTKYSRTDLELFRTFRSPSRVQNR